MGWLLIPKIVLILTLFEPLVEGLIVGELYKKDTSPVTVDPIKSMKMKNAPLCAIECSKTYPCFSFAFGSNGCTLWDAKYTTEDTTILKEKAGVMYYHINVKPDATEVTLVKTNAIFKKAAEECKKMKSGSLVTILDQKTEDKVEKALVDISSDGGVWIGMNGTVNSNNGLKRSTDFSLRWVDGHVVTIEKFQNFGDIDPNQEGKSCVWIRREKGGGFRWADISCSVQHYYLCQHAP